MLAAVTILFPFSFIPVLFQRQRCDFLLLIIIFMDSKIQTLQVTRIINQWLNQFLMLQSWVWLSKQLRTWSKDNKVRLNLSKIMAGEQWKLYQLKKNSSLSIFKFYLWETNIKKEKLRNCESKQELMQTNKFCLSSCQTVSQNNNNNKQQLSKK